MPARELLAVDIERPLRHEFESIDIFAGIGVSNEPAAGPTRDSLLSRASRRNSLIDVLCSLAINGQSETHTRLTDALAAARDRLPAIQPTDSLRAPALIAAYALNIINPQNWVREEVAVPSGASKSGYRYVSPEEEQSHFDGIRATSAAYLAESEMRFAIMRAAKSPERSSPVFARQAVDWAKHAEHAEKGEDETDAWMAEETLVNVALICHAGWRRRTG